MWPRLSVWALAAPPPASWGFGRGAPESDEHDVEQPSVERLPRTTIDQTPEILAPVSAPQHAWGDVAELSIDVAGRPDRVFYLLATGRTANMVVHWRQGPWLLNDETAPLSIELPAELIASVAAGWP